MARDPVSDRFEKRQKNRQLSDLANKARSTDDLHAEKDLLDNTAKVEPIKAQAAVGRNDPCPCGSGKKFKKCCGAK